MLLTPVLIRMVASEACRFAAPPSRPAQTFACSVPSGSTFEAPDASVIRSAAAPPEIGREGIVARTTSASSASAALR
ncbi:hypothetical protein [Streptomyces hirsutus]|uniref:hypothetical protein n=1 Tax=Streptomyces hirsutus TaxID=35620 RepID=UPI0033222547